MFEDFEKQREVMQERHKEFMKNYEAMREKVERGTVEIQKAFDDVAKYEPERKAEREKWSKEFQAKYDEIGEKIAKASESMAKFNEEFEKKWKESLY